MKRSTKELALCGVMTALCVVLLCLGGVVPLAVYACPMLASCALLVLRETCSARYAWCCWAAVALLALLLGPDKEATALYLFLGYYPLLQPKLDAIRRARSALDGKAGAGGRVRGHHVPGAAVCAGTDAGDGGICRYRAEAARDNGCAGTGRIYCI